MPFSPPPAQWNHSGVAQRAAGVKNAIHCATTTTTAAAAAAVRYMAAQKKAEAEERNAERERKRAEGEARVAAEEQREQDEASRDGMPLHIYLCVAAEEPREQDEARVIRGSSEGRQRSSEVVRGSRPRSRASQDEARRDVMHRPKMREVMSCNATSRRLVLLALLDEASNDVSHKDWRP